MTLGIIWWGVLLYQKNQDLYAERLKHADTAQIVDIEKEQSRQNIMIIGEGVVLGLSLLLGIYVINRSAQREIESATQQNNFLLSVSHELKSPIAAIKLALQTLTRKALPEDKKQSFVSSAIKDTNRLERLVQNILLSANMDAESFELLKTEIDYKNIFSQLIAQYQKSHPDHEVKMSSQDEAVTGQGDEAYLKQAISNIIENAIKYGETTGSPEIRLSKDKGVINIAIASKGAAISKADQSKIFSKFYRSKNNDVRSKEGTGLGLFLSHEIIKAHKGHISASSSHGSNTFSISIPEHV